MTFLVRGFEVHCFAGFLLLSWSSERSPTARCPPWSRAGSPGCRAVVCTPDEHPRLRRHERCALRSLQDRCVPLETFSGLWCLHSHFGFFWPMQVQLWRDTLRDVAGRGLRRFGARGWRLLAVASAGGPPRARAAPRRFEVDLAEEAPWHHLSRPDWIVPCVLVDGVPGCPMRSRRSSWNLAAAVADFSLRPHVRVLAAGKAAGYPAVMGISGGCDSKAARLRRRISWSGFFHPGGAMSRRSEH